MGWKLFDSDLYGDPENAHNLHTGSQASTVHLEP